MRAFTIGSLILLPAFVAQAQVTVTHTKPVVPGTEIMLNKTRNELKSPADTNKLPELDTARHKVDSLKNFVNEKKSKLTTASDSIQQILNLPQQKVIQATVALQSQVDSLVQKINKPVDKVNDELTEKQQSIQGEIDEAEAKVRTKVDAAQNSVQQNANKAADGNHQIRLGNQQLPEAGLKIPGQESGINNFEVPNLSSPGVNPKQQITGTENLKLPDTKLDVNKLKEKADINVPGTDKINNVSGEISKIDGKLSEAEKYSQEIKNIKENGLGDAEKIPDEIEKRVGETDEIKALNAEAAKVTEYKDVVQKYKDKKLIQREIQRKAQMVATEKMNAMSPEFKAAQQQIAKARKLNPAVKSFKEMTKRRTNEMKGKPFRQRFVPGITIQAYNAEKFTVDCAIQTGYRLSGRLTMGAGYTYRISMSEDNTNFIAGEGVSGYRFYADFVLLKGFYIHGEFEKLSLNRSKQPLLLESSPDVVNGSYFGIGKRYNVSRKVKGSVSALYRVNYTGEVPGQSKVTLRVGLDLNLKKQKRKALPSAGSIH